MLRKLIVMSAWMAVVTLAGATPLPAAVTNQWNLYDGTSSTTISALVGSSTGTIYPEEATLSLPGSPLGGDSVSFDGTSSYVLCAADASQTPSQMTFVIWAKNGTGANNTGKTVANIQTANHYYSNYSWSLTFDGDGKLFFRPQVATGGVVYPGRTAANPYTATMFQDGNWHQFVGTYSGSAAALYVDGVLIESLSLSGSIAAGSGPLVLGSDAVTYPSDCFNGRMGGPIQIYDSALTLNQIKDLFYVTRGRQIILDRGLQLQAWAFPSASFSDVSQWNSANYSTVNFANDSHVTSAYMLSTMAAGQKWSRVIDPNWSPVFKYLTTAFPFYDDFGGASLDSAKWLLVSGTATVASSEVTLGGGYGEVGSAENVFFGTYTFTVGSSAPTGEGGFGLRGGGAGNGVNCMMMRTDGSSDWKFMVYTNGGTTSWSSAVLATPAAGDVYDIVWTPTSVVLKKGGNTVATCTTVLPNTDTPLDMFTSGSLTIGCIASPTSPYESTYAANFVNLTYGDELTDLLDSGRQADMLATYNDWRNCYPNALAHTNVVGVAYTEAQMETIQQATQPDLLLWDWYLDEDSSTPPSYYATRDTWYTCLGFQRIAAMRGYDLTGQRPLPYGQYTRLYRESTSETLLAESFIRAQKFVSLAYGYTFLIDFVYNTPVSDHSVKSELFSGMGDASASQTTLFSLVAATNLECSKLGPALTRLVSLGTGEFMTGVYMKPQSDLPPPTAPWTTEWSSGVGCPHLTGITRQSGVDRDIVIGFFKPLKCDTSDYSWVAQTATTWHFMVTNGAIDGTASASTATLRLTFTGVPSNKTAHLEKMSRSSGSPTTVSLTKYNSTSYRVDVAFPGGTGELFKFWY